MGSGGKTRQKSVHPQLKDTTNTSTLIRTIPGFPRFSKQFYERQDDPDFRFIPVDWTFDEKIELFDYANELLVAHENQASDDNFVRHKESGWSISQGVKL